MVEGFHRVNPDEARSLLAAEFEKGYVPCDEPPGLEEREYQRWKAAGGVVKRADDGLVQIAACLAQAKLLLRAELKDANDEKLQERLAYFLTQLGPLLDSVERCRARVNWKAGKRTVVVGLDPRRSRVGRLPREEKGTVHPLKHFADDEPLSLGPCCICGSDYEAVTIVQLNKKSPTPGRGWGCAICNLPPDGAVAIVCKDCIPALQEKGYAALRFACTGYPGQDGRTPIQALTGTHDHDATVDHNA